MKESSRRKYDKCPSCGRLKKKTSSLCKCCSPDQIAAMSAKKVGVSVTEWTVRRAAGEKWCTVCRQWLQKEKYKLDRSRTDGLSAKCADCHNKISRDKYKPEPKKPLGSRRSIGLRNDDKSQARGRVNYLVKVGVLPHPSQVVCFDCGHIWLPGERRHEMDHAQGYSVEHHETVEVVCSTCHKDREFKRGVLMRGEDGKIQSGT